MISVPVLEGLKTAMVLVLQKTLSPRNVGSQMKAFFSLVGQKSRLIHMFKNGVFECLVVYFIICTELIKHLFDAVAQFVHFC